MWERSSDRLVVVVVVLILSAAGGPAVGAVTDPSSSTAQLGGSPVSQQGIDTDSVRLMVSVTENGSAMWTVEYWTRLDDENTTDAFESLRSDIESSPSNFSERFATRMRSTVRTAENATGREMNATGFEVRAETRTPPDYGVITYSFHWNGFAAVDGDTIRVGDAIEGIFLDERTRLVIEWPTSYAAADVAPAPDDRRSDTVVWRGAETSFVSGEPALVLQPASAVTNGTATATGTGTGAGRGDGPGRDGPATSAPDDGGSSTLLFVGLGLLLVVGAAAWRYRDWFGGDASETATAPVSSDADGPATDDASEDLLSNEERVLEFVREQGGRVKQQEIVEAFDWTEARTSQIVRDLRDEGNLEGFRLGRENVLKLPDDE